MTLEDLGYNPQFEEYRKEQKLEHFAMGRVIMQHRDRYTVKTESNEYDCELIGNLRFSISDQNELPFVGDWVAISEYDEGKALIHGILPRYSILERKAVGKFGKSQVIAVNIDVGLIIQSVNRDFNINRLERYLTICYASKIEPVIIISKIDLIEEKELEALLIQVKDRIKNVPIIPLSNHAKVGIDEVITNLAIGKTFCLLGSSGVGKSTLINSLMGKELMNTREISENIDRGKHVTTHRALLVSEHGILIDNPGMREIGITDASEGFEMTFDEVLQLSQDCKYKNCTHTNEDGCSVIAALDEGELDIQTYENFLKMEKERYHYESSVLERKKKGKELGKRIKNMKKINYKY